MNIEINADELSNMYETVFTHDNPIFVVNKEGTLIRVATAADMLLLPEIGTTLDRSNTVTISSRCETVNNLVIDKITTQSQHLEEWSPQESIQNHLLFSSVVTP